ncbi:hypothetical protein GW750_09155 [bacterium]|nr:hypothetical protein [bacterium]
MITRIIHNWSFWRGIRPEKYANETKPITIQLNPSVGPDANKKTANEDMRLDTSTSQI